MYNKVVTRKQLNVFDKIYFLIHLIDFDKNLTIKSIN